MSKLKALVQLLKSSVKEILKDCYRSAIYNISILKKQSDLVNIQICYYGSCNAIQ